MINIIFDIRLIFKQKDEVFCESRILFLIPWLTFAGIQFLPLNFLEHYFLSLAINCDTSIIDSSISYSCILALLINFKFYRKSSHMPQYSCSIQGIWHNLKTNSRDSFVAINTLLGEILQNKNIWCFTVDPFSNFEL